MNKAELESKIDNLLDQIKAIGYDIAEFEVKISNNNTSTYSLEYMEETVSNLKQEKQERTRLLDDLQNQLASGEFD